MRRVLLRGRSGLPWTISPRTLFATTGSLVGTMVVTSGLGAVFWWVAARLLDQAAVGFAGAATAAMQVLAVIGVPGIGTLLIRELPRHSGNERRLIATSLSVTGLLTAGLGAIAAVTLPFLDADLAGLSAGPIPVAVFTAGVALTGIGMVVDLALLGLQRPELQFARNIVFSGGKLVALLPVAWWIGSDGLLIFATWVVAAAVSAGALGALAARRGVSLRPEIDTGILRGLGGRAFSHYGLNLSLQIPVLGMPLVIGIVTSAETTGQFYIAWLVASLSFYVPLALAQTLYAVGARAGGNLASHVRQTVGLSIAAAGASTVGLLVLGNWLLGLFGPTYAELSGILPVLSAGALGLVFKDHYHVLYRIRDRTSTAALVCAVGGTAEVAAAFSGVLLAGLPGMAWAWLAILAMEAVYMGPMMLRAARETPSGLEA